MYMKKQTYMSPMTNLFVVSLEEGILQSSPVAGQPGGNDAYNDYDEDF